MGRALWAANKIDEGLEVFVSLEQDTQYGPVYAYLGDAYMYGIGGVEVDQELAISLYRVASDDGFSPATDILAALNGDAEPNDLPVQSATEPSDPQVAAAQPAPAVPQDFQREPDVRERPFNKDAYLEPEVMSGLYHGNMDKVSLGSVPYMESDKVLFYFSGFLKPFEENYNFRDASCVYLSNPTLVRIINTKALAGIPGVGGLFVGNGQSLEQTLNSGAEMGWKMMGDMLQGLNSGKGILGSDYGQAGIETTLLAQHGEKDSTRLIDQHGCGSETVTRIFANLSHFVTGQGSPTVTAEEKQRQTQAVELEKKKAEEERQRNLRASASKSCVSQYKKRSYCGCLIEGLDEEGITETEWKSLGQSFGEVVAIGRKYEGIVNKIRSCRLEKG